MEPEGLDGRKRGILARGLWSCQIDLGSGGIQEHVHHCIWRVRGVACGFLGIGQKCSNLGAFGFRIGLDLKEVMKKLELLDLYWNQS